jgi:hypothetical protein
MNREFLDRLRAVENEYLCCHAALTSSVRAWATVSDMPEWQGRIRSQAQEALERLESTYIVRLFSEFEAVLREYWTTTEEVVVPDRVEGLINRLGSRYRLPAAVRERAHEVQYYRNALLHRGARRAGVVSFGAARRALNFFLAGLPDV